MRTMVFGTGLALATLGLPAAALAASSTAVPTLSLRVNQSRLSAPGTVTVTATPSNAQDGVIIFWVESPDGQWRQYLAPAGKTADVIPVSSAGSYLIQAYAFTEAAWSRHDWAAGVPAQPVAVFVESQAALSVNQSAVPVGQSVTLTASSRKIENPEYQFWVENPAGHWSIVAGYGPSAAASLSLTQMGTYRVIAYAKQADAPASAAGALPTTTTTVTAFGPPETLSLGGSAETWADDGQDVLTVPVRVVDGAGDTVDNVNGTVAVTVNPGNTGIAIATANGWMTLSNTATVPVTLTNGSGDLSLRAGNTPGTVGVSATWGGLTAVVPLSLVAQVPTALTITGQNAYLLANESGNPAVFDVNVVDQAGYPMLTGTYTLSATIVGDTGQFHDLTQGPDAVTVTGGNGPTPITVYSIAAGLGPMTLYVAGDGFSTVSSTIPAILGGQPSQMAVTAQTTTLSPGSSTTLTLAELTKTGGVSDPASLDNSGYTVTIENSQGTPVSSGFDLGGMPYTGPLTVPTAVGPNYFYAVSQPLSLTVTTAPPGAYQIVVSDPSNLLMPSTPLWVTVPSS